MTVASLAACGGQDAQPTPNPTLDEPAAPATGTPTPASQVAGGEQNDGAGNAAGERTAKPGRERPAGEQSPAPALLQYLRDVCLAREAGINGVVVSGTTNQSVSDSVDEPGGYERLNVVPLRRLVSALRSISPPDDLAVYHDSAVATYEELLGVYEATLELIESGVPADEASERFSSYFVEGPRGPTPPLPPDVRDRLGEAAATVPECADTSQFLFFFLSVHVGGSAATGGPVDPGDDAYVRSLCLTGSSFAVVLDEAATALELSTEVDESDVEAYVTVVLEASGVLADVLREIPPPDDIADYHAAFIERIEAEVALLDRKETVAQVHRILQAAAAGEEITPEDLARLQLLPEEPVTPALSTAQRERLTVAMGNVVECYHNDLLWQFLGLLDAFLEGEEAKRAAGDLNEISVGGSVEGTLDTPAEEDTYSFRAEKGESYLVTTAWEASGSLIIQVMVEDGGNFSTGSGGNASPLQVKWRAEKSGPVYVTVESAETAQGTVSYTVSVLPDPAPKTPTSVRSAGEDSAIRISWDAVEGADYYNVYYSDSSSSSCRLDRDGTPAFCDELATNMTETTYLHADPVGDENRYWVAACNSAGCSSPGGTSR